MKCADCQGPRSPRRTYCEECRVKRRRDNSRRQWQRVKSDPELYAEYLRKKRERNRYREIREDPERYAELRRKSREGDRRRYWKMKADPEKYAEFLRKRRNYWHTPEANNRRAEREYQKYLEERD